MRPALVSRLRLLVLTDPRPACGRPLRDVVEECLQAGARAIQLRDKEAPAAELLRQALELRALTTAHEALLFVNDRFDVALAAGADGVHLGPDDLPVGSVRRHAPEGFLIGYSTDDLDEARRAAREGADYLGVGAVFGTSSKEGLEGEAIGPERVREVLAAALLPGLGIGGITPSNAHLVAEVGAGVAVLGAVMGSHDPGAAVRSLLDVVEAASEAAGR